MPWEVGFRVKTERFFGYESSGIFDLLFCLCSNNARTSELKNKNLWCFRKNSKYFLRHPSGLDFRPITLLFMSNNSEAKIRLPALIKKNF